jgi:hypothetical protein
VQAKGVERFPPGRKRAKVLNEGGEVGEAQITKNMKHDYRFEPPAHHSRVHTSYLLCIHLVSRCDAQATSSDVTLAGARVPFKGLLPHTDANCIEHSGVCDVESSVYTEAAVQARHG